MPLFPPPTIADGLVLMAKPMQQVAQSRIAQVTFALSLGAGKVLADLQDALDDFDANWNTNITPQMDDSVNLLPSFGKLGQGTTVPLEAISSAAVFSGGGANNTPAPNVAVLVKKTTGVGGKKNRGRTYFPWIVDNSHVDEAGHLDGAYQSAMQPHLTAFLNQLNTDGSPMCIANKTLVVVDGKTHVSAFTTGPLVTAFTIEGLVATQRRRLGR